MADLGKWLVGSGLMGSGAIALGYGAGMMWRAWLAQSGPLTPEQKTGVMFIALLSIGAYALLVNIFCWWIGRSAA